MEDQKIQQINSKLLAAGLTLNFFLILNILKESYAEVKSVLNFYSPVGPLLGLFISTYFHSPYKSSGLKECAQAVRNNNSTEIYSSAFSLSIKLV